MVTTKTHQAGERTQFTNPYPVNSVMARHFDYLITLPEGEIRQRCKDFERFGLSRLSSSEQAEHNAAMTALYLKEEAA